MDEYGQPCILHVHYVWNICLQETDGRLQVAIRDTFWTILRIPSPWVQVIQTAIAIAGYLRVFLRLIQKANKTSEMPGARPERETAVCLWGGTHGRGRVSLSCCGTQTVQTVAALSLASGEPRSVFDTDLKLYPSRGKMHGPRSFFTSMWPSF